MELNAGIFGAAEVIENLRKQKKKMADNIEIGLLKAGLKLQAESQKLVPVEYGILKATAFTRLIGKGFNSVVSVGYTAFYALWVHESVGMVLKGQPRRSGIGEYWDPRGVGQAKFLEEPARRLRLTLLLIIVNQAKVKS